jgi:outer membrane biosynthesis protein TonB
LIIACTLDRSGEIKNPKVLEPGAAETTSKVLAALRSWKFRPAFRGNDPVEVTAIIGFGIDTR